MSSFISEPSPNGRFAGMQLSGNALKLTACLCMLADHAAKALPVGEETSFLFIQILGRISFPVFAYLLVEGFFYTGNIRRYLTRLLALALLSEIPFDLAMMKNIFDPDRQNTVFLLFAGLLMCRVISLIRSEASMHYRTALLLQFAALISFAAAAWFLKLDYGAQGIGVIAVFYYSHGKLPEHPKRERLTAAFWACCILNSYTLDEPFAFLCLLPLSLYNRQSGSRRWKTAFYLFYPMHLLALATLSRAL